MGGDRGVLTRRQFLLAGGGSAAAVWAGARWLPRPGSPRPAAAPTAGAAAPPAARRPPFLDAFDNPALPHWNVRRPVAVLGTTAYGVTFPANAALDRSDFLRGRGTVIGLDGPVGGRAGPGFVETVDRFALAGGSTYALRFGVAGSHRRDDRLPPSTIVAGLPGVGASRRVTLRPDDDFREFVLEVPVTAPSETTIAFTSENAPGQAGLLLEYVSLAALS